jgi:hypothetical protein
MSIHRFNSHPPRLILVVTVGLLVCLGAPVREAPAAKKTPADKGLKIKNRTPFIINIYIGGVRSGWVKPFRTEVFKGLKAGKHKLYAITHYGSSFWGPLKVNVPGAWNLTPDSGTKDPDLEAALAGRIYRRNRSSLVACDKLADRRGEDLQGKRADFEIEVDDKGKGKAKVTGTHIRRRLNSCYRAVTGTWKYPETGNPYVVSFSHIH